MKTRIIQVGNHYYIQVFRRTFWGGKRWECVKVYNNEYHKTVPLSLAVQRKYAYALSSKKSVSFVYDDIKAIYNDEYNIIKL